MFCYGWRGIVYDASMNWGQAIGEAFLSSPLGASELIVGLLVATTFIAFAANGLEHNSSLRANGHEASKHQ